MHDAVRELGGPSTRNQITVPQIAAAAGVTPSTIYRRWGDLPALLADCSVGIFPSYVEGFGLAVLEQLAAGIPTVAFDAPGPRQILRDNGGELLTSPGCADAIADRAAEILRMSESEYDALSARCRSSTSS